MSSTLPTVPAASGSRGLGDRARLYLAAFLLVLIAESIGKVGVPLGPAKVVLLPLLWALLLGAAWGLTWLLVGLFALLGHWITYKASPTGPMALGGMAVIVGNVIVGCGLYRLKRAKVPAVVWVSLVGMLLTFPQFPFAAQIAALTGKINFLALATPILAFAGLSIAKDVPAFRRLGWRIVVTLFAANAGTFIGATLVAQYVMPKPVI